MRRFTISVPALLILFALVLGAQDSAPEAPRETPDDSQGLPTLTVDVVRVGVPFSVTDGDERLRTDLVESDFRIYEDGRPQQIASFDAQTELPLTLALLMDTSNSVRLKLDFEKEAAAEFFHSVIERRRDQGMLVTFDSSIQVIQDFTDSPEQLSDALHELKVGGSSAMYDAIYLTIAQKVTHQVGESRRIVVVVSDGDDNDSRTTLEEIRDIAQKNDVVIYTVSTNPSSDFDARRQRRGDDLLEQLANETGGRAFYPYDVDELVQTLKAIVDELRSQYYITYQSSNPARDGSYREIEVRTVDLGYTVTARKGYYAPVN
jgi:Ca-activated chloride channel homolog